VSADATSAQIKHLLSAGARHYLTKPIDVRRLLEHPHNAGRRARRGERGRPAVARRQRARSGLRAGRREAPQRNWRLRVQGPTGCATISGLLPDDRGTAENGTDRATVHDDHARRDRRQGRGRIQANGRRPCFGPGPGGFRERAGSRPARFHPHQSPGSAERTDGFAQGSSTSVDLDPSRKCLAADLTRCILASHSGVLRSITRLTRTSTL
jgi:hypothetical protein